MNYVLDFLGELFEKEFAYLTVGVHKSATSAYHEYVNGTPVGQLPLICNLLGVVFNNRPPQP